MTPLVGCANLAGLAADALVAKFGWDGREGPVIFYDLPTAEYFIGLALVAVRRPA